MFMRDWRFKAFFTLCAMLLAPLAYAQSLPEVRVELEGSLKSFYGPKRIPMSQEAARMFANVLKNSSRDKLKPWTFGITPSSYALVLAIDEEREESFFVLRAFLETRRNGQVVDKQEIGMATWCRPEDKIAIPVCNHTVMKNDQPKDSAEKIVKNLVDIFESRSEDSLSWDKLINNLVQRVPIAENVQWYNKKQFRSTDRVLLPHLSAVTPIVWSSRRLVKKWTPYLWCESLGEERALRGEWAGVPFRPMGSAAGQNETLGLKVWQWQDQPGGWNKIEEPMCREGYDIREVRFQPYWFTEGDVR